MIPRARATARRSWLTALSLSLVTAAGAVLVTAGPAAAAASDHRLTTTAYSSLIDDLDALLPNVSVANVVDDGNRTGSRCYPTMTNLSIAFCWNDNDQNTSYWTPQGITTSGDATATGLYQDRTVILTSWYDSDGNSLNKGVRVSFVNYANTSAPTYRHVLLVEPTGTADAPSFRPVTVHAGGIAWYGNYLYVADTSYGFRVFDMNHIWRVSTGNTEIIGRQPDGTYHAFDYKYVLPQAFRYTQSTVNGATPLRFSTVSVSRTASTHGLAIAEWGDNPDAAGKRLARFDLAADGLLATDSDGLVHADAVYIISQRDIQGTALINGRYFLSQDDGSGYRGNLGVYNPGGSVKWYNDHLPDGVVEAQSYWPGKNQLWSLTEVAGKRRVFASKVTPYDESAGATVSVYGVLPDGRLTYSAIDAGNGDALWTVESTEALGFTPKAMATLNFNTLLITSTTGDLYRVDISTNRTSLVYYPPVYLGSGWTHDLLAYDGAGSLYGIAAGKLRRYTVTATKPVLSDIVNWVTISESGWTLTTLTATGTNWLLGTTSAGALRSYVIRGVDDWTGYTLDEAGWGFAHLTSPGAGIYYGRTSGGGLYHYLDGNPYDGNGSDIQYYLGDPVGSSGWDQILLSAQPFGT